MSDLRHDIKDFHVKLKTILIKIVQYKKYSKFDKTENIGGN